MSVSDLNYWFYVSLLDSNQNYTSEAIDAVVDEYEEKLNELQLEQQCMANRSNLNNNVWLIGVNMRTIEFRGEKFDTSHGTPFDRGSADSYYRRAENPHYYPEGSYVGKRIESKDMSMYELRAYFAGYEYNEKFGDKKDWS